MGRGIPPFQGKPKPRSGLLPAPAAPHTKGSSFSLCDRRKCTSSQFTSFTFMNNDPKAIVDLKHIRTV